MEVTALNKPHLHATTRNKLAILCLRSDARFVLSLLFAM